MYDLIVRALRTDMTRVVTYMSGSEANGIAIPEIGVTQTRHQLSHHNGDADILARLTKSDVFLMQQLAYFLDQLQTVKDGDELLVNLTGETATTLSRCTDLWVGADAHQLATEAQRKRHEERLKAAKTAQAE